MSRENDATSCPRVSVVYGQINSRKIYEIVVHLKTNKVRVRVQDERNVVADEDYKMKCDFIIIA